MAHEDPTFRQRYRDRVDELQQQGKTTKQVAFAVAEEFGVSRLQAFRWAHGHTLKAAAARYNTAAGDPDAPMDSSRLSRYENWPHGARSTQPKVSVLQGFAKTYQCGPGDLIDGPDYTDQPDRQGSIAPAEAGESQAATSQPATPSWPTLLRVLLAQRHWQTYETFAPQYQRAANQLATKDHDARLRGLSINSQQYQRWLGGSLEIKPQPTHCRVLEYLFDRPIDELLSPAPPESEPTPPGADLHTPPELAADGAMLFEAPGSRLEDPALEVIELERQAGSSDLASDTLERLDHMVARLRCSYSSEPPTRLAHKVRDRRRYVVGLLNGKATLDEHKHLLDMAGWLSVLLACVEYDAAEFEAAEASRTSAQRWGTQVGDSELVAWSHEVLAWWAVVSGRFAEAIRYADEGLQVAPLDSSVAVQLTVQQAHGYARLGDQREAEAALHRAAAILAKLPIPSHPEDHFTFDPNKLTFYASHTYAILSRNGNRDLARKAEEHAREVIRVSRDGRWPTRAAESNIDLGLSLHVQGRIDEACAAGAQALKLNSSRPSTTTLWRAGELDIALDGHRDLLDVRDFHDKYMSVRQSLRRKSISPPAR